MERVTYAAVLSAMVVLVFAVIAWAQDSQDQGGSNQYGDAQYGNQQEATTSPEQEDAATTPTEQAAPAQGGPTVSIGADAFDPPQLDVAPKTTVTFVNEDAVAHTVSLEDLFDSYEIAPGSSFPVWLDGSGTVRYHDKANPQMRGTITVGGGAASRGGATTPAEGAGKAMREGRREGATTRAAGKATREARPDGTTAPAGAVGKAMQTGGEDAQMGSGS